MLGRFYKFSQDLHNVLEQLDVSPDLRDKLFLDQASDFSIVMTARAFVGINSVALLCFDFLHAPDALCRYLVFIALEMAYLAVIFLNVRWLRRGFANGQDAKVHIKTVRVILVFLGVMWGIFFNILMPFGDGDQRALIYGLAVGLISTPVLVSPLSCALAFWLPVCVGVCVGMALNNMTDPFALGDLLGFIVLTGYCIIYLNRRMNERAIGEIRLQENSETIKLLLRDFEESASDWLWETNAQMEIRHVSNRLAQVAARPVAEIAGRFPHALLGEIMNYDHRPGSPIEKLVRAIEQRSAFRDLVVPVIINAEERYWSLTGKPVLDKFGHFSGYHGVGSDITGQRRQQEHIAFLARHDSLTKLPNRMLFNEMLQQFCDDPSSGGLALLCLDLDLFKNVNDTLGHAFGDAMLVAVAERLRSSIRDTDLAARLGGDEFAIILLKRSEQEAVAIANRIIERVTRPYYFEGQLLQISISIGITLAPRDSNQPNGLMKNADLALYRAKADGRARWRLYDSEMDELMKDRRALQSALRQALVRDEFRLVYQPIVTLPDGQFVGAEALLRWEHPERGLLEPGAFIGIAEDTGLIGQIGEWVLFQACQEAAGWPAHIGVAINLSPLQFRDPHLVETINRALNESGLTPNRLELEITETTMLETNSQTVDSLWQLHTRGVRIALDDFGTGYSSLSYLRRFPFDKVKIDRSFIRDLGFDTDDGSIILAIIGLAQRMNMIVTAEGVETPEQAELLTRYGCCQAQGYMFGRPQSAGKFAALVATGEPAKRVPVIQPNMLPA
ncbi:MAG: EAL domain-containing protein, partial [Acidocella sp.]|nr:EAL domain-containing protein [Acidocella sp.]